MCIKIICSDHEHEFDPSLSLESQIIGANEVVVHYEPSEYHKIDSFVDQIEAMAQNGVSCNVDITVSPNNYLDGIKLERIVENIKRKLDVNEVVKGLTAFHAEADRKLCEIAEMCVEKISD